MLFPRRDSSGDRPGVSFLNLAPRSIVVAILTTISTLSLVVFIWFAGSANPFTPAGYVGYLTKGAVVGHSRFYGVQRGPSSPGRTWLLSVTNVSITPYTYTEDFVGDEAVLQSRQPQDRVPRAYRVAY